MNNTKSVVNVEYNHPHMKRTKSNISLTNLANSIKQSIDLHAQRTAKRQFIPLKTARSTIQIQPSFNQPSFNQPSSNQQHLPKYQPDQAKYQQELQTNRQFILEKQIVNLEQSIHNNKTTVKNYSNELTQYEELTKRISLQEEQVARKNYSIQQFRNQMQMIAEDLSSKKINMQERIAEKEYYEELISTYQVQYETEAQEVMRSIQLQHSNLQLQLLIQDQLLKYQQLTASFVEWKKQSHYDLNTHKVKNKITHLRMELISLQQKCDVYSEENSKRKIRQLYCIYFKNYQAENTLSQFDLEKGLDVFICQHDLAEDFVEFLKQRLIPSKKTVNSECIENYASTLIKMQELFLRGISETDKTLFAHYEQQINELIESIEESKLQVRVNNEQINQCKEKIIISFSNESIATIQYLRSQNKNKIDIVQIKDKLKIYKRQHDQRIHKIEEMFLVVKKIEKAIEQENKKMSAYELEQLEQIKCINQKYMLENREVANQISKLKEDEQKKQKLDNEISNAVEKWNQRDENKKKLKKLYKELELLNKSKHQIHESPEQKKLTYETVSFNQQNKALKSSKPRRLFESKSVLSLSNPFTKILQKEQEKLYIMEEPDEFIQKKLSHITAATNKQNQFNCLEEKYNIRNNSSKNQTRIAQNKQNKFSLTRKFSELAFSKNDGQLSNTFVKNKKGRLVESERVSLSNMLISRLNK